MELLRIKNLHGGFHGQEILRGLDLVVKPGEVHAIMGPNGSGKSTLSQVIAGHPDYEVTQGTMEYEINGKMVNLAPMSPEERAREGIFLAFQYPIELPGVVNAEFLRAAFNAVVSAQGGEELDPMDFNELVREKLRLLQMDERFLERQVNVNFSGGEKKRNEILQMAVLNPRLALLDETDSGLDVDSLKQVAHGVAQLKSSENAFVLITHYERLLTYVVPDFVHIFHAGRIVCSGDKTLAAEVEKYGFDPFITAAAKV